MKDWDGGFSLSLTPGKWLPAPAAGALVGGGGVGCEVEHRQGLRRQVLLIAHPRTGTAGAGAGGLGWRGHRVYLCQLDWGRGGDALVRGGALRWPGCDAVAGPGWLGNAGGLELCWLGRDWLAGLVAPAGLARPVSGAGLTGGASWWRRGAYRVEGLGADPARRLGRVWPRGPCQVWPRRGRVGARRRRPAGGTPTGAGRRRVGAQRGRRRRRRGAQRGRTGAVRSSRLHGAGIF
jgi:hypothetical protein